MSKKHLEEECSNQERKLINKAPAFSEEIKQSFAAFLGGHPKDLFKALNALIEKKYSFHEYGLEEHTKAAGDFAREMLEPMKKAKKHAATYRDIATHLNDELNLRTRRGKKFQATSVMRLEKKQKELGLLP